jgi:hypothetical protein
MWQHEYNNPVSPFCQGKSLENVFNFPHLFSALFALEGHEEW